MTLKQADKIIKALETASSTKEEFIEFLIDWMGKEHEEFIVRNVTYYKGKLPSGGSIPSALERFSTT